MFSSKLNLILCLSIVAVSATPTPYKRDAATPVLEARAPQFSVNIPNNIPVSGAFPNGITITPQTPSGSIVTGNNNATLFGQLGFKRDEIDARQFNFTLPNRLPVQGNLPFGLTVSQGALNSTVGLPSGFPFKREDATPALAAREPQFSVNIPNNIPVSGAFPNGITITPGSPSGSIVTGNNNSTLFGQFGFKREDGAVEARQFNFTLPNRLPVQGNLPFGLTVTQGALNSTVGLPSGFPFKRDEDVLEARQFNFTLPNRLPVQGNLPFGLTVTQGALNSTVGLPSGFPFKRDDATPVLAAREPQFSVNIPNNIPVSGAFPNGITIVPQTPSGSIVTSNRNSTFPFFNFKRDD
ncbi:unnamed protein product [Peniophora sp. CBMAI 1063]|nr:unnamed protein product [Peniophora sp. CBMAI 1063]